MRQGLQIRRPCRVRDLESAPCHQGRRFKRDPFKAGIGLWGHGVDFEIHSKQKRPRAPNQYTSTSNFKRKKLDRYTLWGDDTKEDQRIYVLKKKFELALLEFIKEAEIRAPGSEHPIFSESLATIEKFINQLPEADIKQLLFEYACSYIISERNDLRHIGELISLKIKERKAARNAALSRHRQSPKARVKNEVRNMWMNWRNKPSQYRSASAFARDMLDKFPDELSSQQTIQRWVTAWKKELGANQE